MVTPQRNPSPISELQQLLDQLSLSDSRRGPEEAVVPAPAQNLSPAQNLPLAQDRLKRRTPAPEWPLETVLDSMRDPFYALGRDWRYTFINRAAEAYYGRPRETMLGQIIWDALPWISGTGLRARYEHAMHSREATTFETASVQQPERFFEMHLFPLGDGLGVSFRDRTERRRAEAALRESETRLEIATEAAELGILDWDVPTGRIICSDRAGAIFGLPANLPVTRDDLVMAIHPEDRERTSALLARALDPAVRETVPYEFRARRPDGTIRSILAHGKAIFRTINGVEETQRYVGTVQDVTERVTAEAALRESEARLTAAADNMPLSMVYQVASSRDGGQRKFVYVSRNCRQLNGVAPEEALENPDVLYRLVVPEHVPALIAAEEKAFRTLQPVDVEIAMRHATSGELRWFRLISAPRLMPDDTLIWDGVQVDVTERKQAAEAVAASEERMRTVLEQMPVGVIMARFPDGRPLFRNAKTLDLLGPVPQFAESAEPPALDAVRVDGNPYRPADCPIARTVLTRKAVDQEEVLYRRGDGETIHLSLSSALIRNDGEDFVVCTLHDVSERKRSEEHLRLLLNELNHRVKNTLATVQSIAAQSFRDLEASVEVSGARKAFEARIFALARAHDVLTRENWEGANLKDIADEAVAPYRGATMQSDPFVIQGPDLRLPPAMALSLSMALHELCTNATKYGALSRPQGQVVIAWDRRETARGPFLAMRWEERHGPAVRPPQRNGFGTRLIERGLARELAGEVRLAYEPDGLICTIDVPLPTVA